MEHGSNVCIFIQYYVTRYNMPPLLTLPVHLSSPPVFSVARSLVFCVVLCIDHCLSFCYFSFDHYIGCPSIYSFR